MVLGKLLILLSISTPSYSEDIFKPKFFSYNSNHVTNKIIEFTFGWGKKLNEDESLAYYQSIYHAIEFAEDGQTVEWYKNKASGISRVVMSWPTTAGYCRRLHLSVIAFDKQKTMSATACHNKLDSNWTWYTDK